MILSIIIPAYNIEAYIGPCIDSIYDECLELSNFEVIVVNDGSTDGTAAVIDGFQERYENLSVVTQENKGLSLARTNGLAEARGEYVWFVDGDDYLSEHAVKDLLSLIQAQDSPSVIMTPLLRYDPENKRPYIDYEIEQPAIMNGEEILYDPHLPQWSVSRFIIRRELFDNKWLFFPQGLIHEDEYFGAVLLMSAERVLVHDKVFFIHRIRLGSIMQSISIRSSYDYVANYSLLKDFSRTLPDSSRNQFLHYVQRLLRLSYIINEPIWETPEFHLFKRKKGAYIVAEFIRSWRLYTFRELASLVFYFVAPNTFRKRFPSIPRQ